MGQYIKSKQLPFTEKFICLATISVSSVYKFSVGFQYELVNLDLNEVCFVKNRIFPIHMKNQGKVKALLNGVDVRNEK